MALIVLLERLMAIALVHWVATKSLETIEKCFIHDYAMIPYITARFCGTKKHHTMKIKESCYTICDTMNQYHK